MRCTHIRYTSTYIIGDYNIYFKKYYNEHNTYLTGDYKVYIIKYKRTIMNIILTDDWKRNKSQ